MKQIGLALGLLALLAACSQNPQSPPNPGASPLSVVGGSLSVSLSVSPTFTRTYRWNIQKSVSPSSLSLALNQSGSAAYQVTLSTSATDANWVLEGTVTVSNSTSSSVNLSSVEVSAGSSSVRASCPSTQVPAGGSLSCSYTLALTSGASGTVTATVTPTGPINGITSFQASSPFAFTTPTTVIDGAANVSDSLKGFLGTVQAANTPTTFSYSLSVGPYSTCGSYSQTNTATFVTSTTKTQGTSSATLPIEVACTPPPSTTGCVLTQGYWKTHSVDGPATPPNPTWNLVGGPNASFYNSGMSWIQLFETPPAGGNAYIQLAHQFMAARLNLLSGASTPTSVSQTLSWATQYFSNPANSPASYTERAQANQAASLLDAYNSGELGVPACP
jgi:hypothetical protein